jgi:hypothetical protein
MDANGREWTRIKNEPQMDADLRRWIGGRRAFLGNDVKVPFGELVVLKMAAHAAKAV